MIIHGIVFQALELRLHHLPLSSYFQLFQLEHSFLKLGCILQVGQNTSRSNFFGQDSALYLISDHIRQSGHVWNLVNTSAVRESEIFSHLAV
jgi:hypothetical protein